MRTKTDKQSALKISGYDAQVWQQERNLLFVSVTSTLGNSNSVILADDNGTLGTFTLDENKSVVIDCSDYIRAYPSTGNLKVKRTNFSNWLVFDYEVIGLISPKSTVIPTTKEDGLLIGFPSLVLEDIGAGNILEAMSNASGFDISDGTYIANPEGEGEITSGSTEFPVGTKSIEYHVCENDYSLRFQPLTCGKVYACVEWVSATGNKKRATWEVRGMQTIADDQTDFITLDNSYLESKGRVDKFTLFLDRLNKYDFWYYCDIVTSSKVEVSFDGQTFDRVKVISSSATIPDGNAGEFNKLEISVNWKRYDAITL